MNLKWPDDFIGKIVNGDCREIMRAMPDKCVDVVLTDIPYNIYQKYRVAGSGTTLAAAEALGLSWAGIEQDPAHCETARKRVEAEMAQGNLF